MTPDPIKSRIKGAFSLHRAWRLVWAAAPRWAAVSLLLIVVQTLLPLLALLLLKQIVDALGVALAAPGDASFTPVAIWIGLAGLVALANALINAISSYVAEAQALAVTDHVSDVIHAKSIAVDLGYYEDPAFHDTLHLVQQDAQSRPANIVNGLKQTLQNGCVLIGIVGLLFTFHWAVGLALLLAALPAGVVRLIYARQLFGFEQSRVQLERQAWYYHWMMTSLYFAREIRLLGIGALFKERYSDLRRQLREGRLEINAKRVRRDLLAQGGATVVLYGTLAAMAFFAIQGSMTLGVIVMYFQGYQRALTALQNVLQGLAWLYEDNLFLKHFYVFLDLPVSVEQNEGQSSVPEPHTLGLVCRDLHFTYPSRKEPSLKGASLEIRPGEVVALVGANGAGKTTLAKLICRLYDPEQGQLSWEDQDLRSFLPKAWRRQVSVVSQDFAQFDMTLAENIWLGDIEKEADPEQLHAASRTAGADQVVNQFTDGLETQLGTHFHSGQELSIGEWQRLALARAWFRNAPLLVFDEPSSSLDPLAEAEMIRSFRTVIGQRSALIISHRLSSVQLADRIYVMDDGRMVENGTHEELLRHDGVYARFFRAQAGYYQDRPGRGTRDEGRGNLRDL
ncbi:MAG: ABC transporter ATP-binding protein [Deltaproteobacteria bacterium]|nr:ABC transporter ATP-binding protein [Deltaproteobacteria bacterium]